MLINISSEFILEWIFSFLEERKKLLIISYNKELQSKLNRNINYYKGVCQKYLEINNDGIMKIHSLNDDSILYEGEHLNKKKNGKGKEYNQGTIIFEGEYKNGKRNGKGKEFQNNKLIFEGEYLNGKREGKGIEYDLFSNLVFEAIYKDNERLNGIINLNLIFRQKLILKGEYKNGKIWNAKGYKINSNEIDFEIINGKGKIKLYDLFFGLLRFEGEYLNGNINGKGKEYKFVNKLFFEGEYLNGEKNGYGTEYYYNGKLKFEGVYKNGLIWEGKGYTIYDKIERTF